jgi:hypothetical protein
MAYSPSKQPWISNPKTDLLFIIAPTFVVLILAFLVAQIPSLYQSMPLWAWVVFVLLIDVAHVHSMLFKTYFDAQSFAKHRLLYVLVPLVSYLIFVSIHWAGGSLWFWRILAYLAVFHFIRQQYGFVRLYNREHKQPKILDLFDEASIYLATVFPILHWHFNTSRTFTWFTEYDFFFHPSPKILPFINWSYVGFVSLYLVKESWCIAKGYVNIPRILLIVSTMLSWYVGIVYFNSDLIFTMLNVVAHGIPYMALVWIDLHKRKAHIQGFSRLVFSRNGLVFFGLSIGIIAYFEEAIWDATQWRTYGELFGWSYFLPSSFSDIGLALLVPLLALPQITHYVLDGFIWRKGFES